MRDISTLFHIASGHIYGSPKKPTKWTINTLSLRGTGLFDLRFCMFAPRNVRRLGGFSQNGQHFVYNSRAQVYTMILS
jgi:hypothetical protein